MAAGDEIEIEGDRGVEGVEVAAEIGVRKVAVRSGVRLDAVAAASLIGSIAVTPRLPTKKELR